MEEQGVLFVFSRTNVRGRWRAFTDLVSSRTQQQQSTSVHVCVTQFIVGDTWIRLGLSKTSFMNYEHKQSGTPKYIYQSGAEGVVVGRFDYGFMSEC